MKRPGRVKGRQTLKSTDFLEPTEVHALIAAADNEIDAAIFSTAAFCGLRLGELLALRWRAVDVPRSLISVEASYTRGREGTPKSGDGRTIPMAPEVAGALARLRERSYMLGPHDLVFIGRGATHVDPNALRKRFHQTLERGSLPRVRLHEYADVGTNTTCGTRSGRSARRRVSPRRRSRSGWATRTCPRPRSTPPSIPRMLTRRRSRPPLQTNRGRPRQVLADLRCRRVGQRARARGPAG